VIVEEVLEDVVDRPDDKSGVAFVIAHSLAGRVPFTHRDVSIFDVFKKRGAGCPGRAAILIP
jgi:hypothetical protein